MLIAMALNGSLMTGFLRMSVYIVVNSKSGATNTMFLFIIGLLVAANAIRYVIMGNLMMPLETFANILWWDTVRTYIVILDMRICNIVAFGQSAIIDYAVLATPLVLMVKSCTLVEDELINFIILLN